MTEAPDPLINLDTTALGVPANPAPPLAAAVTGYALGGLVLPSNTPHIKDYVKILYKRRWLVGASFLIISVATAVNTYTTISQYEADAKILIETEEPNYVNFREVAQQGLGGDTYYQTQYDLLKSRSLARKTLDSLKLWDTFPPPVKPSFSVGRMMGTAISWVEGLFPSGAGAGAPAQAVAADETSRESRAIDALLRGLIVSPVRYSRVVDLKFRSPDPRLAMQIVNTHAVDYIQQNTEYKFTSSKEASDWLAARLDEEKKHVDTAEQALQRYREQHAEIPPEDSQNIVVQKLSALNAAFTNAKTNRLQKEALYNQLKSIRNDPAALDAIPSVLGNGLIQVQRTELAKLKQTESELAPKLGDKNPQLVAVRASIDATKARLDAEVHNVVESIRNEYEAALAQEKSIDAALQSQTAEALSMGRESIQFGVLKREADSSRQVYQMLLQRAKETNVSTALRITNVRIVDFAELPRSPVSPNRQANVTYGLFGGLLVGVLLAFFFEYLDNRIKTPDEIKVKLGIPSLALLPIVRGLEAGHPYPMLNGPAWPALNEAFRTLRTNVLFSSADQGSRSLVVTSTGPNEGKTLVSANLAISLAEAGLRVLILDADLRRPKLHEVFQVDQEPGLSNLIVGGAKASETVKKTSIPGLWVLPAGRVPPNPAELLGSTRFLEFLNSLRNHFDWVVIDTPPVMAVADASVVAHAVTGVVFVIRAEVVSHYAAQAALEQLESARAHVIGGVLNRVDLDRHAYYYSQYYRKEYSDYYSKSPSR